MFRELLLVFALIWYKKSLLLPKFYEIFYPDFSFNIYCKLRSRFVGLFLNKKSTNLKKLSEKFLLSRVGKAFKQLPSGWEINSKCAKFTTVKSDCYRWPSAQQFLLYVFLN